jgi:hypothetical protein
MDDRMKKDQIREGQIVRVIDGALERKPWKPFQGSLIFIG